MADAQNISALSPAPDMGEGFGAAFETLHQWGVQFYALLPNIVVGITLLVLFGFMAYAAGRMIKAYFARKDRVDLGNIVSDLGFWGMMLVGTLIALTIIMPSLNPSDLLASLGIGSIAIGFAFKDILQNWFSGLLILLRLPFRRGDQIIVAGVEGTVVRIEPRATILRTYGGRDIVIPNTTIYTSVVEVNTSQPTRRVEMDFTVGYDYEVRFITEIIARSLEQIEEILPDPAPQVMCWELGSTSLGLKLRWWIKSGKSYEVISRARAVQAIKEAFEANDIDPTDPQLIYYQSAVKIPGTENEHEAPKPLRRKPKHKALVAAPPPPEFATDSGDPERETPKADSKDKTLLSETLSPPEIVVQAKKP